MDLMLQITEYSFSFGFVGMLAGFVYCWLERSSLALEYRMVATLGAMICVVAMANYYYMHEMVHTLITTSGNFAHFPTQYRYIDWLMTTPLLLCMIVVLLGVQKQSAGLMTGLVIADIIMILAGYAGELQINQEKGNSSIAWAMFLVSMFAWLYILFTLYTAVSSISRKQPKVIQVALDRLKLFAVIGWSVYPIGFAVSLLSGNNDAKIIREIIYCFADVINKAGFSVVAITAAKAVSWEWKGQYTGGNQ